MKFNKSFLKQCIAEVLVEPSCPSSRKITGFQSFIKSCIAEVLVEPDLRKKKIYGNPRRLMAAHLIKECIMEVLKENLLSEGFDPTSQGPNMPQENPYPEMNAKMRMLEEEPKEDAGVRYERGYSAGEAHKRSGVKPSGTMDSVELVGYHDALKGKRKASPDDVRKTIKEGEVIYKDRQGGQWVYWIDSDGDRHIIHPRNVQKYLKQGYRIVPLEPWNDPKSLKDMPDKGIMEVGPHGRYAQQAGATPFRSPGDTSIVEYNDQQATVTKIRKEVYSALAKSGFQNLGEEPRDYMEYYLSGFVTVSIFISYDDNVAHVERYYDSEIVDNIPGHHIDAKIPIPEKYDPAIVQKLIRLCVGLKRRAWGDESIFGGIDDIEESQRTQSTEIEWTCPHCGQPTNIPVEIESPSDYIACADCEHCGKEISDPRLDQKVYATVIDYYAGKADYLKDTSLKEVYVHKYCSCGPSSFRSSFRSYAPRPANIGTFVDDQGQVRCDHCGKRLSQNQIAKYYPQLLPPPANVIPPTGQAGIK